MENCCIDRDANHDWKKCPKGENSSSGCSNFLWEDRKHHCAARIGDKFTEKESHYGAWKKDVESGRVEENSHPSHRKKGTKQTNAQGWPVYHTMGQDSRYGAADKCQ